MTSTKRVFESGSESESEEENDDVYEVERILAQRVDDDGVLKYLVKWKEYSDAECTWEPAESFSDEATLQEWNEKRALGDFLPQSEVDRVEGLMADFRAEQTRQEEEREARQLKRRRLVRGSRSLSPVKPTTIRKSTSPIRSPTVAGQFPTTTPNAPTSKPIPTPNLSSHRPSTQAFAAMLEPKFKPYLDLKKTVDQALRERDSTTHPRPAPQTANVSREASHRTDKFRNLSHMNNARKKALREPVPQITNLIAPDELVRQEPAHVLPATTETARPESPLFFEESRAASFDPSSPILQPTEPAGPKANVKTQNAEKGLLRTKSGRQFATHDVLVQLSLGDHAVGDVKIAGFPPWLRSMLIRQKVGDTLRLHFPQEKVYDLAFFADLSANWLPGDVSYGEVQPYEDTKQACDALAVYFEQHDSGAVLTFPDASDSSIAMILHSSALPRWRPVNYTVGADTPRLLVKVRNRHQKGKKPTLFSSQALQPSENASTSPSTFAPSYLSPPAPPHASLPLHSSVAPALPVVRSRATTPPPLSRNVQMPSQFSITQQSAASASKIEFDHLPLPQVTDKKAHDEKLPEDSEWKCDLDHRIFTRNIGHKDFPFVYIAFGARFPKQAEAVKTWAENTFTRDRLIFVEETETCKEWESFCDIRRKNFGIVLFCTEDPAFCRLPGLGNTLGKHDDIAYYNLNWSRDSTIRHDPQPLYTQVQIFPRGTVMLLSESTLRQPLVALAILRWFESNSIKKSKNWKLMLRPHVRAWLEHQALLHAQDSELGRCYLDILVQVHKLSSVIDVTAVGDDLDKLRLLDFKSSSKSERREDFIIAMQKLENYDVAPSANDSLAGIAQRDEILLRHFVGWSVTNVFNHRRFLVIEDDSAREGRDPEIYANAHHIVFQSPEAFKRNTTEKKGGARSMSESGTSTGAREVK